MARSAYGRGDNPPEPGGIRPHRVMRYKPGARTTYKPMYSEEFDEPTNRTDKRIFHVLSHGEKRQYEIARLATSSEENEDNIKENTRDLAESYPWAEEVEEDGNTYYYRSDVGRQPRFRKPPADYEDIEEVLSGIESRLGIKNREQIGISNPTSATLPVLLNTLLAEANEHGKILTTKEHLDRFSKCFDEMLEQTNSGFSTEEPANYPGKTHGLFYTVIARQHESWKRGQAHEEFNIEVRERLDGMLNLLDFVPSEVGNPIMRVLALCDVEKAQKGFIKMLQSNNYTEGELITHAESCYAHTHDTDELVEELSMVGFECENDEINSNIRAVLDAMNYYHR
jgi:tetrahydromethanopterin S-methyltransferase subunit G